jgi:hypothetical protein
MQAKKARNLKSRNLSPVRASITFPPSLYETLEAVARQKKVSLAWVVRDAAERYVAEQHFHRVEKAVVKDVPTPAGGNHRSRKEA